MLLCTSYAYIHVCRYYIYTSTVAGGNLFCDPLMKVSVINITVGACFLVAALCYPIALCCCTRVDPSCLSRTVLVIICVLGILLLAAILGMFYAEAFLSPDNNKTVKDGSVSCKDEIPHALAYHTWFAWMLTCSCGCVFSFGGYAL